jgi:hypothetical protein
MTRVTLSSLTESRCFATSSRVNEREKGWCPPSMKNQIIFKQLIIGSKHSE